jgi:hypothetical protein
LEKGGLIMDKKLTVRIRPEHEKQLEEIREYMTGKLLPGATANDSEIVRMAISFMHREWIGSKEK